MKAELPSRHCRNRSEHTVAIMPHDWKHRHWISQYYPVPLAHIWVTWAFFTPKSLVWKVLSFIKNYRLMTHMELLPTPIGIR